MANQYDVIIIGAGPGGIFSAYELSRLKPELKIVMLEAGGPLEKRKCPIDGVKIKNCINCEHCSIMNGFGGAGAFSDGKYNITNDFGGTLHEYIGKSTALELMHYVDDINMSHGGEGTRLFSTANSEFKKICIQNGLHLLDASVRHLGTDKNYIVLQNLYNELKDKVISIVDTSYTGEEGIREVIAKSADDLANLDVMQEKKLVQRFIQELRKDKGLYSYGEDEVRNNLVMGAVDILLLSEDLTSMRKTFTCPSCGTQEEFTVKTQAEADKIEERCPNCNELLKETDSIDLADEFVEKAEEMNTDVEFISTETEEGMQLFRAFGGIGAILRYYVEY